MESVILHSGQSALDMLSFSLQIFGTLENVRNTFENVRNSFQNIRYTFENVRNIFEDVHFVLWHFLMDYFTNIKE